MLTVILILTLINLSGLIATGVIYFKEKYTIVSLEEWNKIARVFNACVADGLVNEEDEYIHPEELPVRELAGGYGFFRDEIPVEEDLEEE